MISDFLNWIGRPEIAKTIELFLLLGIFIVVLIYSFTGKKRGKRLESYKDIPFLDDHDHISTDANKEQVSKDESESKK